jgi:hypothetical protein
MRHWNTDHVLRHAIAGILPWLAVLLLFALAARALRL